MRNTGTELHTHRRMTIEIYLHWIIVKQLVSKSTFSSLIPEALVYLQTLSILKQARFRPNQPTGRLKLSGTILANKFW